MSEKLRPFRTDVAILPINGRAPERRVPGNLFGREAAKSVKDIEAKLVIPCHFEMFEFNSASPDEIHPRMPQAGTVLQGATLRRTVAQLVDAMPDRRLARN